MSSIWEDTENERLSGTRYICKDYAGSHCNCTIPFLALCMQLIIGADIILGSEFIVDPRQRIISIQVHIINWSQ